MNLMEIYWEIAFAVDQFLIFEMIFLSLFLIFVM